MKTSCSSSPSDKKKYISDIAKILVKDHGKKKYYKPEEVKKAHHKSNWFDYMDFSCWAMSTFSSHKDFDSYHQETGEVCDYSEMKAEMLSGLSISSTSNWSDLTDLDIDTSWLDFGDVFEGLFEGIGDFISAIFDGF